MTAWGGEPPRGLRAKLEGAAGRWLPVMLVVWAILMWRYE